ncbi:MAG: hypothetical protein O9302_00295 [Cyclobacteriaceae bacterium]|jgi:hypothetical protein|nr:hypothetical protein [Cytophagales bacterium]MCZ8326470.1 hypothetical protein [Cyclobacteriaceae bacterium]
MTETQLRNDIDTKLTVPVTQVSKFKELFNSTVDFVLGQNKDDFPDWTAVLVFNTNGTGAGKYCKHPDTNGRKRIFETKTSGNVNNVPPTDPGVTENTHWKEISESASSGIPEYTPGVFASGLKIVYHNHTSLGRRLFLLTEPVRPFTSANIETEIAAGKWIDFTIEESKVQTLIANAVTGLYDLRGSYNASSNLFPAAGGSGNAGAILKGDIWIISVPGTLGGTPVAVDQHVLALVDAPGQTASNWQISKGNSVVDATAVVKGILKLYNALGQNLDGTITQKAISDAIQVDEAFTAASKFDTNYVSQVTISGAIAFTLNNAGAIIGKTRKVYMRANGINKPTFSSDFVIHRDNWVNTINTWNLVNMVYTPSGKVSVWITYQ